MKEAAQKDPSKWILKFQSCKNSHKWSAFCPAFPDAVAPIFQACRGWGLRDLSTKISLYLPQLIWLLPNHSSHPGSLPHCTLNQSKQQLCALFYGLYMPPSLSLAWRTLNTRLFLKDVEYCAQIYFMGYEWAVSVRQPCHYSCCRRAVWAHEPGPFQTHTSVNYLNNNYLVVGKIRVQELKMDEKLVILKGFICFQSVYSRGNSQIIDV